MLHTCALDKLSDLHSWPQQQLIEKTPTQQWSHLCAVRRRSEGAVSTQHKRPMPLVLPHSHSWDRGEKEGPALAQLCSATSDLR